MGHGARRTEPPKAPDTPVASGAASPSTAPAAAPATATAAASTDAKQDVVLLGPPTADGAGVHVIRAREERIETGELRALQEGKPIAGEVLTLKPRKENPRVCDVADSFSADGARHSSKGPAKVSSQAYRDGWDEIFGAKSDPAGAGGQKPN